MGRYIGDDHDDATDAIAVGGTVVAALLLGFAIGMVTFGTLHASSECGHPEPARPTAPQHTEQRR